MPMCHACVEYVRSIVSLGAQSQRSYQGNRDCIDLNLLAMVTDSGQHKTEQVVVPVWI